MKCLLPFQVTFPFHPLQYSPNALISVSLSLFAKHTNVRSLSFTPLLTSSRTSITTWRYVPLLPPLPAMPISRQLCACSFKCKILVAAVQMQIWKVTTEATHRRKKQCVWPGCAPTVEPEGKWPPGRPRFRWENNLRMNIKETEWKDSL